MFQSPCTPRPWKVMVLAVVDKMLIHLSCQKEMDLYRIFFHFTLNVRMSNGKYWHFLLGFWHFIYFIEEIEVTLIYVLCTKQRKLLLSHFRIDKGVKSQSSNWQKTTHLALNKKAIVIVILPSRHNCLRGRVLITDTISCSFSMETLGTSICLVGKPWVTLVYVHYTEKNRIDCVLTSVYC